MQFSFPAVLFLFGALQALLFILGLWRNSADRQTISFRLLITLLASIGVILAHHAIFSGLSGQQAWHYAFMELSAASWLLVPPTLYLFVRSLTEDGFCWRRRFWWFFAVSGYQVLSIGLRLIGFPYGFYLLFGGNMILYTYAWVGSYLTMGAVFGLATLRLLSTPRQSARQRDRLQWLQHYVIAFLVAIGVSTVALVYLGLYNKYTVNFEFALLLVFEFFVLAIVYQSIRRSTYSTWLANRLYGATAVAPPELRVFHQQLNTYVKANRPYLDPTLKLSELARGSGITENDLSQVFSQHLGTSFYAYINEYRLRAFEARLGEEASSHLTISGLAEECGFKSKTSLYKVFREKHGTTPVAFLKRVGDSELI